MLPTPQGAATLWQITSNGTDHHSTKAGLPRSKRDWKGTLLIPPQLYDPTMTMAHEALTIGQPPRIMRPHEHNDRPPVTDHGSPDIWMDGKKGSTEEEYNCLPQTLPFVYEIPTLTACKMLTIDQPPCILRPHEHNDRSPVTDHGSLDI